ncbi:hypothetical protein ACKWTF_014386 [Chironomus riparius]
MKIECKFSSSKLDSEVYICEIDSQKLLNSSLLEIIGEHQADKTNEDVQCVYIINCSIQELPKALLAHFSNIKVVKIENSKLTKLEKLENCENLEEFSSINNNVEFLPGNLFENCKNIQKVSFPENKLKIIQPNILDGLEKINFVDFRGNINYDCWYSADQASNSSTINDIREELIKKFITLTSKNNKIFTNKFQNKIKRLKGTRRKLRIKTQNLEQSHKILTEENQKLKKSQQHLQQLVQFMTTSEDTLTANLQKLKQSEMSYKISLQLEKSKHLQNQSQPQSSFHTDIKTFLQNQNFKDFRIQIDDREFQVHKFILAARSSTLAEFMTQNPNADFLILEDISVNIFETILMYIYTDELPGDDKCINYNHLYAAASRLDILELKKFAASKVMDKINQQNAVEVLMLSNKHKHYEMKQKAFEEIKKSYPEFPSIWMDKPKKVKDFIEVFGEYY